MKISQSSASIPSKAEHLKTTALLPHYNTVHRPTVNQMHHMDEAPGLQSPRITGHDLMSLFPAPSPLSSQMQIETRCRLFERQERAFFAVGNPEPRHILSQGATQPAYGGESARQSPSAKLSPAAQIAYGNSALSTTGTLGDPSTRKKAGLTNMPVSSEPLTRRHATKSRHSYESLSCKGIQVGQGNFAKSVRRTSRRALPRPQRSSGSIDTYGMAIEVAAIEARRVDRETGLTWVEVEYRPCNPAMGPHYTFQNIVSGGI